MTDARAALAELTGGTLPPGLAALDDADLERLQAAVEQAQADQAAALERSIDDGLAIVPRVLRGPLKKAIFG